MEVELRENRQLLPGVKFIEGWLHLPGKVLLTLASGSVQSAWVPQALFTLENTTVRGIMAGSLSWWTVEN